MKEFGEGVDRIYRDMAEAGLPELEYKQSEFMLYATLKNKNWGKEDASWTREEQVREQDREQVGEQDEISRLIDFCSIPRSRSEMMEFLGLSGRRSFSDGLARSPKGWSWEIKEEWRVQRDTRRIQWNQWTEGCFRDIIIWVGMRLIKVYHFAKNDELRCT